MTVMFMIAKLLCFILVTFCVKKPSYISANSVCYSFYGEEALDTISLNIASSIWQYKLDNYCYSLRPKHALKILLIISGDIELCPGPCSKCNVCGKGIRKNQSCVSCSGCTDKYHLKCLSFTIKNSSDKFYCNSCYTPEAPNSIQGAKAHIYDDLKLFLKSNGMKIFHQNVNGLFRKLYDIKILLQETQKEIHILGITIDGRK